MLISTAVIVEERQRHTFVMVPQCRQLRQFKSCRWKFSVSVRLTTSHHATLRHSRNSSLSVCQCSQLQYETHTTANFK
ncbi:hypothetical protein J6590_052420 [Homalodisca vitripennis]|nr:hypothetical protein J6590_052420 [Homalodisca vitripennis]